MNDVVMGTQLGNMAREAVALIKLIANSEIEIRDMLVDEFCDLVRKNAGGEVNEAKAQ